MKAKTILVPIDFSDVTASVAEVASSIARAFGGNLVLLHVEEPEPTFVGFEPGPVPVQAAIARDTRAMQGQLEELSLRLRKEALDVETLDVEGPVAERIRQEAQARHADLIVIGSHGHGAIYNLLVGSVTSGVLKAAPCPVLVVPAQNEAKSRERAQDSLDAL